MRTRCKICGLTRAEDVDAAIELGVDYIGLVAVRASRRYLPVESAVRLAQRARGLTQIVLLLMDHEATEVERLIERIQPDVLQFHGSEDAAFCERFARPYFKAVATRDLSAAALAAANDEHPQAVALLWDGHAQGELGGQGTVSDLSAYNPFAQRRGFLAGGLSADNVAAQIERYRPFAVDVSSGVENAPGEKSKARMRALFDAITVADAARTQAEAKRPVSR